MKLINRHAITFALMMLVGGSALLAVGPACRQCRSEISLQPDWLSPARFSSAIVGGYNVPRNDRLAALDSTTPEAVRYWSTYLTEWNAANYTREAFCLLAAV